MSWGFEPGRVYNRRTDIHQRFGGQQQGGIITPADHAVVIIVTGEEGLSSGYDDQYRPDGVFEYFGEGQIGDMAFVRGNQAIANHSAAGKGLLLFRKTKSGLRFEAEMVCSGHLIRRALDRDGNERDAIVFELRPLDSITEEIEEVAPEGIPLDELKIRAMAAAKNVTNDPKAAVRNVYQRSRDVRDYVLARASGNCEACSKPAPFLRPNGTPYLEPHHLRRRSDGGPDHPAFVIATCPTCHRRVHFGADGKTYNDELLAKMPTIEPES